MISFIGDHDEEIIHFPNKMSIIIDFGSAKHNDFGGLTNRCMNKEYRRIRLFDENENLISETIEENPHYNPNAGELPKEFFEKSDPKILY